MIDTDALFGRWRAVWLTFTTADPAPIYLDLLSRYAEPHRAYHTLEHIAECLLHLDEARHLLAQPIEVELAVWFHDAIYDPRRGDNEEQSALLAVSQLRAAEVDEQLAAQVANLIRLTNHARDGLTGDAAVLCDVDLAILGAEPRRFWRYDAAIRREYGWVPEPLYQPERERVLSRFLDRPRIYFTPFFHDKLESQARTNITAVLSGSPPANTENP